LGNNKNLNFAEWGRGAVEAAGAAGDGRRRLRGRLRGHVDGGRGRGAVAVGGGAARPAAAARRARDDAAADARVRGTNSGQPRDAQLGRQALRRRQRHQRRRRPRRQLPAQTLRQGHQQVHTKSHVFFTLNIFFLQFLIPFNILLQ
jgi:hypothetical protein